MYKMDIAAMQATYEMYKQKEEELIARKESLQTIAAALTEESVWQGEDAESFRTDMQNFLDGEYQETLDKVSGMRLDLGRTVDGGKSVKAFCDNLADALDGNSISIQDEENVTGTLFLDPSLIPVITSSAKVIGEQAEETERIIANIESILNSLETCKVDISEEASAIRSCCRDFENIGYFGTQVSRYAEYVESLNEDVARRFSKYVEGDTNYRGIYQCYVKGEAVNTDRLAYLLSLEERYLTKTEKQEIADMKATLYETKDMESIMLLTDSILQQDASEWSDSEAAFAAEVWAYLMETDDVENIERFLSPLQAIKYGENEVKDISAAVPNAQEEIAVWYCFSDEKIGLIMEQLDANTQGEAYYTLNRILHFYDKNSVFYYGEVEPYECFIQIEAENSEEGIVLQFTTPAYGGSGGTESFTVMDLNEVVGAEGIANLKELGFSEEQINALLKSAYNDTDVDFVSKLSNADETLEYYEAFKIDPNELSSFMNTGLYLYSDVLLNEGLEVQENGVVSNQNLEQYMAFLNGILYCKQFDGVNELGNPCHTGDIYLHYAEEYLGILIGETSCALTVTSAQIEDNYDNEEQVKESVKGVHVQSDSLALYSALYYYVKDELFCDPLIWPNCYQIQELELTDTDFLTNNITGAFYLEMEETLNQKEYLEEDGTSKRSKHSLIVALEDPTERESREEVNYYVEKAKEAHWAIPKAIGGAAIEGLTLGCPYVEVGVAVVEGLADASKLPNAGDAILQEVTENEVVKNSSKMGITAYDEIWSVVKAYQEKEAAYQAIRDDWNVDAICVNGTSESLSEGQYQPQTIINNIGFNREGISFMAVGTNDAQTVFSKNIFYVERDVLTALDKDPSFKGVSEETRLDMLSLVWCAEVYHPECQLKLSDLTDDQIVKCLGALNNSNILNNYMGATNYEDRYNEYVSPYLKKPGDQL